MTCRQILTDHPKGKDFGWILQDMKKFPLLSDAKDEVLSMAPIINSATLGAVQVGDKDLMVELTGDNIENLVLSANIVACDFADQGYEIKPILVKHPYDTGLGKDIMVPYYFQPTTKTTLSAVNKLLGKDAQVTDKMKADAEEQAGVWKNNYGRWKLVSDDTLATVYNAIPAQCNKDVVHTASMFKLNLADVLSQRVIAMERTFMAELGLKYGDIVYVDGTEKWDGPWQIQDTMNKRFAGMHKIDILVPRNIRAGKWDGVKISVPADQQTAANAKSTMKGSA
jgi:uncharacterized cupin superfamily protein